jgi:hypothetical protein
VSAIDPSGELRARLVAQAGPVLGPMRASLGVERFLAFTEGHAMLQAMAVMLVISITAAPASEYSDAALEAVRVDAQDVRDAADRWAKLCELLADQWQAQRQQETP